MIQLHSGIPNLSHSSMGECMNELGQESVMCTDTVVPIYNTLSWVLTQSDHTTQQCPETY